MTVETNSSRKTYAGDNVTTSFDTSPVVFFDTSDLEVSITTNATGASVSLTENTDYTVTGGSGAVGTISLAGGSSPHGALLSGTTLVIVRVVSATQTVDFVNGDNSDAEVAERALDKLTMLAQQLEEGADRAIKLPTGDTSGSTTELPAASTRAGTLLGFDAVGLLTTYVVQIGTSLVNLAAAAGSSLIGFIQAGTGAVLRTLQDKNRDIVSVKDFGAKGDGVTDDTAVFAAAALIGGRIYAPAGTYLVTDTTLFALAGTTIEGDGPRKTIIKFAPTTTGKPCFHFKLAAASEIPFCGVLKLGFDATGNTQGTKTAIRITDAEEMIISDIEVSNWTSVAHDCIGLQFRGRQTHDIFDVTINADLPISIETNPNNSISIDHYHFCNTYLLALANPCVKIADGVNLSQVTFDGFQAWVTGTYGLLWNDTTTVQASQGLTLKNVRTEQGTDPTAYVVSITHNAGLQGLVIDNCNFAADRKGFFFRNVPFWHIKDSFYADPAKEALNIDNTTQVGRSTNTFWQQGGTASITGLARIFQFGSGLNVTLASDFCYMNLAAINPTTQAIWGTGTTTNAVTGEVGEYVTASLASGSALSLTSPNALTVTSLSLTGGDWDVWGVIDYLAGGATTFTVMKSGISTSTNAIGSQDTFTNLALAGTLAAASDMAHATPVVRISLAPGTTSIFLVAQATFAASTLKVYGTIFARRRR
jgi:hypothetical protein